MRNSILVVCAAIVIGSPAIAASFKAQNRLLVNSINATDFEVVESRSLGAAGSWCAAADFATRVLNLSGKTDLIVKTPRGPSGTVAGKKAVVYTVDPNQVSAPLSKSVSVSTKVAGMTLPVGHALTFCSQSLIDIGQ